MIEGPVSDRRISRRKLRQYLTIGAVVTVVLMVVIGIWYGYSAGSKALAEAAAKKQADEGTELARAVATPFAVLSQELNRMAKQPQVVQVFTDANPVALRDFAESIAAGRQHWLKLRFLVPGSYEQDDTSTPPLTFASLDMLKRAEATTGAVATEVHRFGDPTQHVVMVQRVLNAGGELIGLIHLSLDVAVIEEALSGVAATGGYVQLRQPPIRLVAKGDSGSKSGNPLTVSIPGTRWSLDYWNAGNGVVATTGGGGGVVLMAVLVLLLVAAAVVGFLRFRGGGRRHGEGLVYAGAVQAIMDGVHPGMEAMVPHLPKVEHREVTAEQPSAPLEGDDITRIAAPLDGGAATENVTPVPEPGTASASPKPDEPATAESAEAAAPGKPAGQAAAAPEIEIDPSIFRAYDIRGVVGENFTEEVVRKIGQAVGSEAKARGVQTIVVGRDGRNSSPDLAAALIKGINASGRDTIDVGMVPTPVLYFATHELDVNGGVMLTGSHNGPEYNGLKIVLAGETLSEDAIQAICQRIRNDDLESGTGSAGTAEIIADYVRRVAEDIPVALGSSLKIVIDCGNGVAGAVAPQVFSAVGHDVIELFCDVDGSFPNHHPDPSQPENLEALRAKVAEEQADLGLAFDGDGDRLGLVDGNGNIIWPDRQLMLLAQDVLSRNQGAKVIFDVKCSRHLKTVIEQAGGVPLMWRTGHSLIKKKMKEEQAPLAGEMSGHMFVAERWYGFDDAMYAAARLIEIFTNSKTKPADAFAALPDAVSTPELRVALDETVHATFMEKLKQSASFDGAEIIDIDGIRVEFADGWGLVRPSNTSPFLTVRFEADNDAALNRIQEEFRSLLQSVNPDLALPF